MFNKKDRIRIQNSKKFVAGPGINHSGFLQKNLRIRIRNSTMDMADLEMFYELVPVVAGTEAVAADVIHADTMLPAHKHTVGTVQIFHLVSYN